MWSNCANCRATQLWSVVSPAGIAGAGIGPAASSRDAVNGSMKYLTAARGVATS